MKKSITKNYIYNLTYQILVLILPIITTPYLSRVLGSEGIGIYSYTISIVTYFILFGSLGISMYAQREIAYIQEDKEERSKIFYEIFFLKIITLTISMILFYFTFVRNGQYSTYYKILLLEIISAIIDIGPFFQGMEEFKKVIKRNLIVKFISIISIFVFVKQKNDLFNFFVISVVSNFIGNISLWFYLPKYISKINIKSLNLLRHIKPTIILFIPQIATQIYTVLDKTMLGSIITNKSEVGYYEQTNKLIKLTLTIVTSLGTVMLTRIANEFARGRIEQIKNSIIKSFNFVYFLSIPIVFGIVAVAKDFIPEFLGQGFEKCITITYIISPIILLIGLSNVIGTQYLLPTHKQKQYTVSVTMGAIINLIANFILIPKFQSYGAAIGTIVAETIVTVVQINYIKKEFNIKEIIKMSIKYFIAALIMFIIILVINKTILINLVPLLRVLVDIVIGVITYLMILLSLKDVFLREIIEKILNKNNKLRRV